MIGRTGIHAAGSEKCREFSHLPTAAAVAQALKGAYPDDWAISRMATRDRWNNDRMEPRDTESMTSSTDCLEPSDGATPREGRTRRGHRSLVRWGALVSVVVLLIGGAGAWPAAALIVPALSPYVTINSVLARCMVAPGAASVGPAWPGALFTLAVLVCIPVLLLVLISRRFFCRYACPVGLLNESLSRLRPAASGSFIRLPYVGRWIVLATVAGSLVGYPLALWLDPLAIFSGALGVWHDPAGLAGWVALSVLALIAITAALWPGVWCRRLCPLGATQDLLTLGVQTLVRPGRALQARDTVSEAEEYRLPRRRVISVAAGTLAAAAGAGLACGVRSGACSAGPKSIRPPGAADESQFSWLCIRCGNCVRTCPAQILHPDQHPGTVFGFLTPVVRFDKTYCKEDCRRCMQACPSGAIAPLTLAQKQTWPMGLARVDMSWCLLAPENGERECAICRNVCPYQAIQLDFNYDTYVTSPRVNPQKCPGCGACEAACPGSNEAQRAQSPESVPLRKAIFVEPRGVDACG